MVSTKDLHELFDMFVKQSWLMVYIIGNKRLETTDDDDEMISMRL
jgi:hypothetical protein